MFMKNQIDSDFLQSLKQNFVQIFGDEARHDMQDIIPEGSHSSTPPKQITTNFNDNSSKYLLPGGKNEK